MKKSKKTNKSLLKKIIIYFFVLCIVGYTSYAITKFFVNGKYISDLNSDIIENYYKYVVSSSCLSGEKKQNEFYTIGNKKNKLIALSFDDGPGLNTKEILKILDDKKVKATFFILGSSAKRRPELVKKVYAKGHEIANHTYNHINFFKYKKEDIKEKIEKELLQTQDLIKSITNYKTNLVRYPYGYADGQALKVAKDNEYKVINWTFGIDWNKNLSTKEMLELYLANIKPGYIFLMHDLSKNSKVTKILPILIDTAKKKDYKFVTVSEIINQTK